MIYGLLRHLLFRMDPELAHGLALAALRLPLPARRPAAPGPLAIRVAGLDFPNPVGLAAGFDKDGQVPDALLGRGFGFVEVGSITPLPQVGNPRPRLFRLAQDQAIINRMGFNNQGADAALRRLTRQSHRAGIVGINIGANKDSADRITDYIAMTRLMAPLAAKGPHPAPVRATLYPAGMVSAADPRAAEAGAQMLRRGGSAADAAMATLLALNVVEPQSSGIGGGGYAVIDDGKGHITSFDGRETAPHAATGEWFYVNGQPLAVPQAIPGGRSVGVPGNVALMAQLYRTAGHLPWRAVFAPALALARDGFAVSPRLHDYLGHFIETGALSAAGRALYYQPDGTPVAAGTIVHDPALARFLEQLARLGPAAFYTGDNAQAIAAAVSDSPRNPAPLTAADVSAYRAVPRAPVCFLYRHYRLCGMGPSSSGATTVFGILGLLERFDLAKLGPANPVSWHLIAEAMRLTYADRDRYLADSTFEPVPVAGLLSKGYLAARSQLIAADHTIAHVEPGNPPGAPLAMADTLTADVPSTSHFVAIDRSGEVVTMTSTIESPFGSGLMVNGYFLNNELTDFSIVPQRDGQPVANRVEPGKRPRSAMAPTLVYAPDGHLRLAIGAAGGATIPAQVVRAIIGVLDWNLSAQQAIALPVLFAPGGDSVLVEQGTSLQAMIPALQALGHAHVEPRAYQYKANAIEVVHGRLAGAADPRSEGQAISQ